MNANGNKIDVWLIYQCTKCKHTKNLTVYERCRPESIWKEEYKEYLRNSRELALKYGTNSQFFARNRVEVDWLNIKYTIQRKNARLVETEKLFREGDLVMVFNSYALKIRTDKVVSEILNLTRSRVKGLERAGIIVITEEKQEHTIRIEVNGKIES